MTRRDAIEIAACVGIAELIYVLFFSSVLPDFLMMFAIVAAIPAWLMVFLIGMPLPVAVALEGMLAWGVARGLPRLLARRR